MGRSKVRESDLWKTFRDKLFKERLKGRKRDVKRIENNVALGTPDVNYCIEGAEGWVELKHAREWPKRGGPLKLRHFTPEQRLWIHLRQGAGGKAFVLLKVEDDYFLFWNIDEVGKTLNRAQLIKQSIVHRRGVFPTDAILLVLKHKSPSYLDIQI